MPQIALSYDQYGWEFRFRLREWQRRGGRRTPIENNKFIIRVVYNKPWTVRIIIYAMDLSGYVLILKETEDNKAKLLGKHAPIFYHQIGFLVLD